MTLEISVEEKRERQSGLRGEEILPPIAEDRESALIKRSRWKRSVVSGALVMFFLAWFWISIVEPRLNWLGPLISGTSSAKLSPSELGRGEDTSYLHSDENLVRFVQHRLNQLGFRAGRVDGVVGPRTMEALERFQVRYGLAVSGVIDRQTKEALDRIDLPKPKVSPYEVARARREEIQGVSRFIVDLSMNPALSREAVEKHVKEVTILFAKSNPDINRFHVKAYLGIASLSAGAYAIAEWDRKGKDVRSLEGFQIRYQEWTRKGVRKTLPSPKR